MDPQSLVAGLVRGLGLLSLAGAIGGLVLERLILPASAPDLAAARVRLRRLITGCLFALALTTLGDLVIRTQAMSRAPLAAAIAAVPDVMARTHVGAILAARAAGLALAIVLSLAHAAAPRALCLLVVLGDRAEYQPHRSRSRLG